MGLLLRGRIFSHLNRNPFPRREKKIVGSTFGTRYIRFWMAWFASLFTTFFNGIERRNAAKDFFFTLPGFFCSKDEDRSINEMKWHEFSLLGTHFSFLSHSSYFGSDWKTWFVCADSRREIRANGFAISVPYRRRKWFSEITTLRSEFRYSNFISRLGFGVQ